MSEDLNKYVVPVFVVAYGADEVEAIEYVERALDNTQFVFEDGIFSAEVLEDDVLLEED